MNPSSPQSCIARKLPALSFLVVLIAARRFEEGVSMLDRGFARAQLRSICLRRNGAARHSVDHDADIGLDRQWHSI